MVVPPPPVVPCVAAPPVAVPCIIVPVPPVAVFALQPVLPGVTGPVGTAKSADDDAGSADCGA